MEKVRWISSEDWEKIVDQMPIVSVDLLILVGDGILLGKRENQPAKGHWFVPGGRLHKGEELTDAVNRISSEELNIEVEILDSLGAHEHFYETSDVSTSTGKHYIANSFLVEPLSSNFEADSQHSQFQVFTSPPENVHDYVLRYTDSVEQLPNF